MEMLERVLNKPLKAAIIYNSIMLFVFGLFAAVKIINASDAETMGIIMLNSFFVVAFIVFLAFPALWIRAELYGKIWFKFGKRKLILLIVTLGESIGFILLLNLYLGSIIAAGGLIAIVLIGICALAAIAVLGVILAIVVGMTSNKEDLPSVRFSRNL